jgi:hypothetical protein
MKMIESKEIRRLEHVTCMADEKCVELLVGKPIGKRLLGRPRRAWKDDVMYVKVAWLRIGTSGTSL